VNTTNMSRQHINRGKHKWGQSYLYCFMEKFFTSFMEHLIGVTPRFSHNCNYAKTSCKVIVKHVIMFIINTNTKQLTRKEALSTGHDTTCGMGEVELDVSMKKIGIFLNIIACTYKS
jgi:hypothetical protein